MFFNLLQQSKTDKMDPTHANLSRSLRSIPTSSRKKINSIKAFLESHGFILNFNVLLIRNTLFELTYKVCENVCLNRLGNLSRIQIYSPGKL